MRVTPLKPALASLAAAATLLLPFTAAAVPPVGHARSPGPPLADPAEGRAQETADLHRVAVFGRDNRSRLPKHLDALRQKIGLIYNERTRTVCSAFCVGDDVIATASHCVYRTRGETPPPAERFFFARPGTSSASVRFAGAASRSSAQQIVAGAVGISTKPPIEAARDWALIKLQGPACRGRTLAVKPLTIDEIEKEAAASRIYQVAFHRDYGRWTMAYSEPCFAGRRGEQHGPTPSVTDKDFSDPLNLVLHTCDTGGASSGSPLLVETSSGPQVVAINVGTFVQARVMIEEGVVVRRSPAAPVANTAVNATAFAAKLEPMRAANVLTRTADIMALQRRLQAAGMLTGPLNGRWEQRMRFAIETWEARNGLPVLGLPTRALLTAMERRSE
jgi:hypothetical protein